MSSRSLPFAADDVFFFLTLTKIGEPAASPTMSASPTRRVVMESSMDESIPSQDSPTCLMSKGLVILSIMLVLQLCVRKPFAKKQWVSGIVRSRTSSANVSIFEEIFSQIRPSPSPPQFWPSHFSKLGKWSVGHNLALVMFRERHERAVSV